MQLVATIQANILPAYPKSGTFRSFQNNPDRLTGQMGLYNCDFTIDNVTYLARFDREHTVTCNHISLMMNSFKDHPEAIVMITSYDHMVLDVNVRLTANGPVYKGLVTPWGQSHTKRGACQRMGVGKLELI